MRRRNRSFKIEESNDNFWPSFADVMSTFALVMLFIIFIVFVKNIVISINLRAEQVEVEQKVTEISNQQNEIDSQQAAIIILMKDIASKEIALDELAQLKEDLEKDLSSSEDKIAANNQFLIILSNEIEAQRLTIDANNDELTQLRNRLNDIAVLRAKTFQTVIESINVAMGRPKDDDSLVTVGDNASIILSAGLVFDSGASEIKASGVSLLNQMAIAFQEILEDEDVRNIIDSICIEGHTDAVGSFAYNAELSINRAKSVWDHLVQANPNLETIYGEYFTIEAFGEHRLLVETINANAQNRRIEFSIKLKDDSVQQIIEEYLKNSAEIVETD